MAEVNNDKNLLDNNIIKMINGYLFDYFSFIVIYAVLVLIVFGYFYVLNPKYKSIVKNNELYQNYKNREIEQLNNTIINYQKYRNVYAALADNDKDRINNFFPDYNDSEELLIYLRNMLARGNYKMLSVNIESLGEGKNETAANQSMIKKADESGVDSAKQSALLEKVNTINISLKVANLNYDTLKSFLYFIERDARFFDIENVNFSSADGGVELKLKTYYLK